MAAQLYQLASTGRVTAQLLADSRNITLIRTNMSGRGVRKTDGLLWLAVSIAAALVQ